MKAELSNSNVQIPITRKRVPEQYQIFQIRKGKAFTRFRSFDIRELFRIWSVDIGYCSAIVQDKGQAGRDG